MRVYYWIFVVLWSGVAFFQFMWKGVSLHVGSYGPGHWGMRYTEEIIGAELLLLAGVGLVVHFGKSWLQIRVLIAGIVGCLMLLGLHISTYRMDSGFIFQKELAGAHYQIPWRYHPSGSRTYNTIGIWVVYPGFSPLEEGLSQNQTKLWFQKSPQGSPERPSPGFEEPRRVDVPECSTAGNWVYCRFYRDEFWYEYSYPTDSKRKIEVPIGEVMSQLPVLLDSFVESRP